MARQCITVAYYIQSNTNSRIVSDGVRIIRIYSQEVYFRDQIIVMPLTI